MFDNKYPYTDFHELNLDWFMGEFKKLVAEWEETKGEWNSLHDYVQNYFNNLNVQTEIDNKINAMIADGTFADIVSPFVTAALPALVAGQLPDVVAAQISAVVAAQISAVVAAQLPAVAAAAAAQEVGTWLTVHIDPDTGYVIDNTLTVSQAAADAKVTGDAIRNLDNSLDDINPYIDIPTKWSQGAYNISTGEIAWSTTQCRSEYFKFHGYKTTITPKAGYKVRLHKYSDTSGTYIGYDPYTTDELPLYDNTLYYKLVVAKTDGSELLIANLPSDVVTIRQYGYITIKDIIDDNYNIADYPLEHGIWNDQGKDPGSYSPGFLRTKDIYPIEDIQHIVLNSDYYLSILFYDADKTYLESKVNIRDLDWSSDLVAMQNLSARYFSYYIRRYQNWTSGTLTLSELTTSGDYVGNYIESGLITLDKYVDTLADKIDSNAVEYLKVLPSYYDAYMPDKITTINEKILNAGLTGDSFIFISDLHWPSNAKKSPNLIKAIFDQTPINRLFMNGDYQNNTALKTNAVKLIEDCVSSFNFDSLKKYVNVGNHEYNDPGASQSERRLSNGQVKNIVVMPQYPDIVFDTENQNNVSFYFDEPALKKRYIFIGSTYASHISTSTIPWFAGLMEDTPAGYDVVVITHIATTLDNDTVVITTDFQPYVTISEKFNARESYTYSGVTYDYSDATGQILAIFSGHTHRDEYITTDSGLNIICTTTDANGSDENRISGTVNEQAFDVVTIDKAAMKIYLTRIGYGSDREFTITPLT